MSIITRRGGGGAIANRLAINAVVLLAIANRCAINATANAAVLLAVI